MPFQKMSPNFSYFQVYSTLLHKPHWLSDSAQKTLVGNTHNLFTSVLKIHCGTVSIK